MKFFLLFLKGFGMGAANVIPGVSGGTIALVTGVYEELIESLKSFNIQEIIFNRFDKYAFSSFKNSLSLAKIQAWFFPIILFLIGLSNLIVIYIGGKEFIDGNIEIGVIAEFIIYVNMLTWPVTLVGWVTSIVKQAEASQKRINEFLDPMANLILC